MSRPRIWLAAASVGERTFAVGGYDGAEYLDLVEAFTPGPPDAKTGFARRRGVVDQVYTLSAGRSTMGLAACQGTLYAVGGFAAPHYLATVEAYDPRANQWWGCAPLAAPARPRARGGGASKHAGVRGRVRRKRVPRRGGGVRSEDE